jgi:homoserine O-acetyltransferase/O-succinyltransferase
MAPIQKAERHRVDSPRTQSVSRAPRGQTLDSVALPDPFTMYRGGVLHGARIAYESWGQLSATRDNAILLFTGLSPSAHAAATAHDSSPGWWQRMIGPALAIDTNRYFVLCVNSLGSCFGSTGPASINPATGERYRLEFPELAVEDIASAGHEAARALGASTW